MLPAVPMPNFRKHAEQLLPSLAKTKKPQHDALWWRFPLKVSLIFSVGWFSFSE
jgi:hypothetical protein